MRRKVSDGMIQPISVRIDERLIHGQVAAVWTKTLSINRVIVIDDEVVKNPVQKKLLKTACPDNCKLSIISTARAAENFLSDKYADERPMVIVKWPETLVSLSELGVVFDEVIVGNMPNKPGSEMLTKQIFVTDAQKEMFRELSENTSFAIQLVPLDAKSNLMDKIDQA